MVFFKFLFGRLARYVNVKNILYALLIVLFSYNTHKNWIQNDASLCKSHSTFFICLHLDISFWASRVSHIHLPRLVLFSTSYSSSSSSIAFIVWWVAVDFLMRFLWPTLHHFHLHSILTEQRIKFFVVVEKLKQPPSKKKWKKVVGRDCWSFHELQFIWMCILKHTTRHRKWFNAQMKTQTQKQSTTQNSFFHLFSKFNSAHQR